MNWQLFELDGCLKEFIGRIYVISSIPRGPIGQVVEELRVQRRPVLALVLELVLNK
jgi:hypothetical protein